MTRFADPTLPHRPLRLWAGGALALLILLLIGTVFWSIWQAAPLGGNAADFITGNIPWLVGITTLQASLSTVFSLLVGTLLAWALDRLRFPGRTVLIGLFGTAIVLPGVVVAFGLLSVWGRSGWISAVWQQLTGRPLDVPIFGLGGVVAAHVILDGAFAARVLLARLDAIPEQRLKTGQSLALSPWLRFRLIDWPAMAGTIPGLAAIIFLLAFTSFPIVLLLGGGPSVETLEVAIYSAVRLDFDLALAVKLALVQVVICAMIILFGTGMPAVAPQGQVSRGKQWKDTRIARTLQGAILAIGVIGFTLPLLSVLVDGGTSLLSVLQQPALWSATSTSLALASSSAILTLVLALILATARASRSGRVIRMALSAPAYVYLAVPAVTLSLGAFLLIRGFSISPDAFTPVIVLCANALLSLPFAVTILSPALDAVVAGRGRLIRSLNLSGWQQFTLVEWPLIARDAGLVLALAFCFSLGDLGVVALFGSGGFVTLPLLMLRAISAYRTNDAAAISALMLVLTLLAFITLPKLFGRIADAAAR